MSYEEGYTKSFYIKQNELLKQDNLETKVNEGKNTKPIDSAYMEKDTATGKVITKIFKTIQERKKFFEEKGFVNSDYPPSKRMADYFALEFQSDKDKNNKI